MSRLFVLVWILVLFFVLPADAHQKIIGVDHSILVVVSEFHPTVIKNKDGSFTGFEIELFEAAAQLLGVKYRYKENNFKEILDLVRTRKADMAIAGITITAEREGDGLDFSHRTLDSGLRIMIRKSDARTTNSFFSALCDPAVIRIFITLIMFCILMGFLFRFFENRNVTRVDRTNINRITGVYWALVTSSTVGYGDVTPKTGIGKIIAMFTILGGIAIFGIYLSAVSSINVARQFESTVMTPQDLAGKSVATIAHTTSVKVLQRLGAHVVSVVREKDLYKKLLRKEVAAVVYDEFPLMRFATHEGVDAVLLVGPVLEKQDYGFAFPEGSTLREKFNRALLMLYENGSYDVLHKKYFG